MERIKTTTSDPFRCLTCNEMNFFRDILDSLPYRVWMQDMTGEIIWENRMAHGEICGPSEDITVRWRTQIDKAGYWEKVAQELYKARQGESGVVEFKRKLPTGDDIWVRLNFNPVYNQSGEQVGVYGFEKDITLQKEALPKLLRIKASCDAQLKLNEV